VSDAILGSAKLDHVGIAAEGTELPLAALLAAATPELRTMPSGVAIARFGPDRALELVVPTRTGTPIGRFLERRGAGLHHVALSVDEPLAELLPRLREAGFEIAGEIELSSDGRPSLFLHPSSTGGILVELVEGERPA
jgi:catechol 2,3-dioxygenase-like lactoylglutathione lyase family enzyme